VWLEPIPGPAPIPTAPPPGPLAPVIQFPGPAVGVGTGAAAAAEATEVVAATTTIGAGTVAAGAVIVVGTTVAVAVAIDTTIDLWEAEKEADEALKRLEETKAIAAQRRAAKLADFARQEPTKQPAPLAEPSPRTKPDGGCDEFFDGIERKLQEMVDRAVEEIRNHPEIAKDLMSDGSYVHLVLRDRLFNATFGKAVERLIGRQWLPADPELRQVLEYTAEAREGGKFTKSPDFTSVNPDCPPATFDITTGGEVGKHIGRGYTNPRWITYEVPTDVIFP
jgi:hypothetical protein